MIEAQRITKYYGGAAAVSEVSFSIAPHQVVGLLGLNGAGKTTTLRMLSGLLVPSSGRIRIDDIDMADEPERARGRIGFLPEAPPLYVDMTVEGFLMFVARIHGVREGLESAITEALEATAILDKRHARIRTLSHGYRRRVGIAATIVHRPALILLDEPTSGLDPVQIVNMRDLIRSLKTRHTVMVSSHILSEIHEMCDRIFVLHQGRIHAEGTEAELAGQVAGMLVIELEVRGTHESLSAALAKVDAVEDHEVLGSEEGVVRARVRLKRDDREGLAAALVAAGLGVRRFEPGQSGLEAIFLKLTRDGSRTIGGAVEAA